MPRVHPNRTAGARHGVALRGGSQPGADHPVLAKRARRARRRLIRDAKALIGSSDPDVAVRQLEFLKRRWQLLGPASPEDAQRLRQQFEAACAEVRSIKREVS
jgi:hypothetical protein